MKHTVHIRVIEYYEIEVDAEDKRDAAHKAQRLLQQEGNAASCREVAVVHITEPVKPTTPLTAKNLGNLDLLYWLEQEWHGTEWIHITRTEAKPLLDRGLVRMKTVFNTYSGDDISVYQLTDAGWAFMRSRELEQQ